MPMPSRPARAATAAVVCAGLLACPSWTHSSETRCSPEQAAAAEEEAGGLRDWSEVHRSYVKYAACDDGSVAEGYCESISRVLDDRWTELPDLHALAQGDARFEGFVLRHLNETVPPKRLASIRAHALRRCPPGLSGLCRRIASTIERIPEDQEPERTEGGFPGVEAGRAVRRTPIAPSGTTTALLADPRTPASVVIRTRRADHQSLRAVPGWPEDREESVISDVSINVGEKQLFVPTSVFADLIDPIDASVSVKGRQMVLVITGGDGSEGYVVRVYFDATGVHRRTLSSLMMPDEPLEDTRYWQRVLKDR